MDTRQTERCKFKEIAKIKILKFVTKQSEMDKTAENSGHQEVRWIRKAKHE